MKQAARNALCCIRAYGRRRARWPTLQPADSGDSPVHWWYSLRRKRPLVRSRIARDDPDRGCFAGGTIPTGLLVERRRAVVGDASHDAAWVGMGRSRPGLLLEARRRVVGDASHDAAWVAV